MLLDIHSHILFGVDDGAKTAEDSIAILQMMKNQGITDVVATPHFYPQCESLEEYTARIDAAFEALSEAVKDKDLPKIYKGTEVLYFSGISKVGNLDYFKINGSNYILLETVDQFIGDVFMQELLNFREQHGITPIIAHIERLFTAPNFKKFLKFVKENHIPTQINAAAVMTHPYKRVIKKLLKNGLVTYIATDSHSVTNRPPLMSDALEFIENKYGTQYKNNLIENSRLLLNEITQNGEINAKQKS